MTFKEFLKELEKKQVDLNKISETHLEFFYNMDPPVVLTMNASQIYFLAKTFKEAFKSGLKLSYMDERLRKKQEDIYR